MGHKKFITWYKIETFCTHTNKNVIYVQKKNSEFSGLGKYFFLFSKF